MNVSQELHPASSTEPGACVCGGGGLEGQYLQEVYELQTNTHSPLSHPQFP